MHGSLPQLRSDLEFLSSRTLEGDQVYVVKDPQNQRVFELGKEEFFLCRQFDGHTDAETIRDRVQRELGRALSVEDVEAFARHLDREGLFDSEDGDAQQVVTGAQPAAIPMLRIPLGNPDRLLGWLAKTFRWCATRLFFALTLLAVILGVVVLVRHGGVWLRSMSQLWNPVFAVLLLLMLGFCVTAPKEIIRGIACRYYGAHVREIGVRLLFYIIPRFYIDLTQFQQVRGKSQRIWIIFASAYSVVVLWALGVIGWLVTTNGSYPNLFFLALSLIAGIWGMLFVWNPLRRGDAYQLLSTWLEVPELRKRALGTAKAWLMSQPLPEPLSDVERRGFRWFGVLTGIWFIVFFGGILLAFWDWLTTYYTGAGAIVFAGLLLFLLYRPMMASVKRQRSESLMSGRKPARRVVRWLIRVGVLAIFVYLMLLPYPYRIGGPIELRPVQRVTITSEVGGIIASVNVREGDWVEAGQPVAKLVQRDFVKDFEVARASLREAQAKLDLLLAGPKPEEVAEAEQAVREEQVKLRYSEVRVQRLLELHAKGVISSQEYDNALTNRDVTREELVSAKVHLELVKSGPRREEIKAYEEQIARLKELVVFTEERAEKTVLITSISGWIVTPHIHEKVGQRLAPGDEFGVVEDSRLMHAEILVPEDDSGMIAVGQPAQFRLWSYPKEVFLGRLVSVAPVATTTTDPDTKVISDTVRAIIEVPNDQGQFKTGLTGYAKIDMESMPVWRVLTRRIINWFKIEFWSWLPS